MASVSPFGDITWSNMVNYSVVEYCPYKEEIKNMMKRNGLIQIKIKDFKK